MGVDPLTLTKSWNVSSGLTVEQWQYHTVFSPAKIEGIGERHNLSRAGVHIRGFGSTPILLKRQINTEGIGSPYPLSMLGRTACIFLELEKPPLRSLICIKLVNVKHVDVG